MTWCVAGWSAKLDDQSIVSASPFQRHFGGPSPARSRASRATWLGLASVPGISYAPPKSLLAALSHASRDAFTLPEPTASAKLQTKRGVPKAVLRALEGGAPDYDAITDEAARRAQRYGAADALVALSSLVEANPGDGVLARDVGFSAMQWGAPVQAYGLFSRVASTRPWEPQSWRAMALAASDAGRPELAVAWFEVALGGGWDPRFGDFAQVHATILRDVGRPGETREEKVITLATGREMHAIGVLELD